MLKLDLKFGSRQKFAKLHLKSRIIFRYDSKTGITNTKKPDSRGCYSNIKANVPFFYVCFLLALICCKDFQKSYILDVFQNHVSYLRRLLPQNRLHTESRICSRDFIISSSCLFNDFRSCSILFRPAKHHSTALLLHLLLGPCCKAMGVARHGCWCFGFGPEIVFNMV